MTAANIPADMNTDVAVAITNAFTAAGIRWTIGSNPAARWIIALDVDPVALATVLKTDLGIQAAVPALTVTPHSTRTGAYNVFPA